MLNSYILAQEENPYQRLKLLQKYLKVKGIADMNIRDLKKRIDRMQNASENRKKVDKIEALLFTREGTPKQNRYGSSFCTRCQMYKDYEKECPYCGSLELTL